AILNEATCTIKAQKLQQCEVSETWTNPLLSAAGGLTPGQTLQPDDLSSAMETSTNLVAFPSDGQVEEEDGRETRTGEDRGRYPFTVYHEAKSSQFNYREFGLETITNQLSQSPYISQSEAAMSLRDGDVTDGDRLPGNHSNTDRMAMRKGSKSKASNKLVITSAAFQDHIIRSLLHPNFSLLDPLPCYKRNTPGHPQGRGKAKETGSPSPDGGDEREYVLDPAPPPLTLAQKLGLVASPAERLTEDEWMQVKARSIQQQGSAQPCAICREEFRLQPQVLLSCSHVFHRACLQAFEKFSGRKCCPMCRREQYETRVIHDAARLFRHRCATRIQAYWRGYVARKWYRHVRKTICPKDKRLQRKFFEAKELNDSFVRYCHTDTEAFLSDIDRSLSSSRRVFQQLERKSVSEPQEDDWDRIQSQVIQRGVWDCPICLTALCSPNPPTDASRSNHQQHRRSVLLSCSHLFHLLCLEAFEAFTADSRPSCPLCRSVYHKKLL
ncbi:hypothetical protein INR49_014889, partial [Caranx melampygus]